MLKPRKVKQNFSSQGKEYHQMLQSTQEKKDKGHQIFNEEQLEGVNFDLTPKHVAIIMDGNRRWANQNGLPFEFGYVKGAARLKEIVQAAIELNILTLTVYGFSTENWKRPKEEVETLLNLFKEYLITERDDMVKHGVCLTVMGNASAFNEDLREVIIDTQKATSAGTKLNLVLALNYGGRDDIRRALTRIAQDCVDKKLQPSDVSETLIGQYLDTANFEDPDLLIRTSGEFRLSNFLIWQLAYTEVSVLKDFWPDFKAEHLLSVVKNYVNRERRRGI
ncbi:MAG: Ditrans,polycis-undecaprenyl-diphosphate synthase ((2E,6E)-farnesyl-diphosphate specific) [Chlamydiae bacterium]|nr:Ditrans,polycis-undecaprenyl-diphosphate synthase ((2E,6E)-farnesyl-diphosphate specific) [Chlamydiota bacterium]